MAVNTKETILQKMMDKTDRDIETVEKQRTRDVGIEHQLGGQVTWIKAIKEVTRC